MLKLLALFLLMVILSGCGTTPTKGVDRQKPISCMQLCPEAEPLPTKGMLADTDLLSNHVEAMEISASCATDHKCLVDWINAGDK